MSKRYTKRPCGSCGKAINVPPHALGDRVRWCDRCVYDDDGEIHARRMRMEIDLFERTLVPL